MKIRARKTNRKTPYELEDFLLKEFSIDKEKYVHDNELSCNECQETEDEVNHKDSVKSFLVKFKADKLSDPKSVRPGVAGFVLPDEFDYELVKVSSFFKSIKENHYNLKTTEVELKRIVKKIHENKFPHVEFTKNEANNYLVFSYKKNNWDLLLNDGSKTKWREYVGKLLKKNLTEDYGKIDTTNVEEAIRIDKVGFTAKAKEITNYNGFNEQELTHLAPYL